MQAPLRSGSDFSNSYRIFWISSVFLQLNALGHESWFSNASTKGTLNALYQYYNVLRFADLTILQYFSLELYGLKSWTLVHANT